MKSYVPNNRWLREFIYGESGAGKSTHLATACLDERTRPMLWLDIGGNPESIRVPEEHFPTIVSLEKVADLNDVYDWLLTGQPIFARNRDGKPTTKMHPFVTWMKDTHTRMPEVKLVEDETNPPLFKSLAFDGATEFQRLAIMEITGNREKRPGDPLQATEIQHWGQALNRVVHVVRLLYQLPMHVMLTALEDDRKDETTGAIRSVPWLWGQAREEVPAYSLLTMRLVRKADIPIASERAKYPKAYSIGFADMVGPFVAKEQYHMTKKIFEDPTITAILDAIGA